MAIHLSDSWLRKHWPDLLPPKKRGKRPERVLVPYHGYPGPWELILPGFRPATTNQLFRGTFRARIRLAKRDREVIWLATAAAGIPRAYSKRRVSLTITLGPRGREADVDASWKSMLDALKHAGMIVDDTVRWCQLGRVEYQRGMGLETRICLEDV